MKDIEAIRFPGLSVSGGSKARDGSQIALKKAPSRESIAASIARAHATLQ